MRDLPVGRVALGCLAAVAVLLGAALVVRCSAGVLAPARGDDDVTVASVAEVSGAPLFRDVALNDAPPIPGERSEDGVRTLAVIVAAHAGRFIVMNAQSPLDACPVELQRDRLVDCNGTAWTLAGEPLEPGQPPLQRFPTRVDLGAVVADFSRGPVGLLGTQPA